MRLPRLAPPLMLGLTLVTAHGCGKPPAPSTPAANVQHSRLPASGVVSPDDVLLLTGKVDGPMLLDVRTPEEFAGGRVPGAFNIPVDDLPKRMGELSAYKERGVITYCEAGVRAAKAQALLKEQGIPAALLDGSMSRWRDEHRPIEGAPAGATGATAPEGATPASAGHPGEPSASGS